MKMLIQISLVALLFGGISAGGSYYFHQLLDKKVAAAVEAKVAAEKKASDTNADGTKKSADDVLSDSDKLPTSDDPNLTDADLNEAEQSLAAKEPESPEPPAAVRAPWEEHGDEAGNLINKLRSQAKATTHQERRMHEREQMMNLVVNDMRYEQANSVKLRKYFLNEAKQAIRVVDDIKRTTESERAKLLEEKSEERRILEEQMEAIRREKDEAIKSADDTLKMIREEQEELRKQLEALRNPPEPVDNSGSPEETSNLKNLVTRMDSMPPEETSKILQELVKKGGTAGAIAILNAMGSRQSAKVISSIAETNAELAADLVERLKKLNKDGSPKAK